jgi:hypothetical protein
MKRLIVFVFLALSLSACYVDTVEPRYDPRDRILGYYEVEEYSETYNDFTYYSMQITKSGYDREIYLHNFYAADIDVYAILNYDKITIPFQIVDGYEIEGVGTVFGDELNLNYSVRDRYNGTRKDYCETVAWFEY